jgi:hypothetical protein
MIKSVSYTALVSNKRWAAVLDSKRRFLDHLVFYRQTASP